jgi:tetratricopeptide (TPR) repeat protein
MGGDIHITREILRAVARGELPEGFLARLSLQHLMNLCPYCRGEIEAWEKERGSGAASIGRTLQALPLLIEKRSPVLEQRRREAQRDLAALLDLPAGERAGRIHRARRRFRGPILAELLIHESRKQIPGNPHEAYHLAELARTVVHHSPGTPETFDLIALATAHMANASRASGDLRQAEAQFGFVRFLITHQGVTETTVLAQIDHFEGSLRKDQRRFTEAEELFTRAAMFFRIAGAVQETARVMLSLGTLYFDQRRLDRAIEVVTAALERLPVDSESRLYLYGRHNLALYLAESGQYERAADLIEMDEDLYRHSPEPWLILHLRWLEARIAAGVGDSAIAEQAYLEARHGFLHQGIGYDAAMVSLDLALLYLREGRSEDVKALAEEMLPIFQAQDVHREALAALLLFQDAARRDELTVAVVNDLAAYLKAARTDPTLRYRDR